MYSKDLRPSPRPYHCAIVRQLQRVLETATDSAVEAWRSGKHPAPHWQDNRLTAADALLREEILEKPEQTSMTREARS